MPNTLKRIRSSVKRAPTVFSVILSCCVAGILLTATATAQPNSAYDIYVFDSNTGVTQW